ncbi:hypothetical protein AC792_00570 [Arthrobacter sp. RIT-PI-e]|uniref:hypothetical protein n=1 Tax=Arthrobacter sp. RIT-PI-e TaxID=1681197 RepID=UPI000675CC12|nr:hypothetical protein [Arthrobacter sp. RIT-PI-e]KNC20449.1 hypothetical protein AC792_00570 [Arthrobacter sp. RIT-PI-e]
MSTEDTTDRPAGRPAWFGAAVMLLILVLVGLAAWGVRTFFFTNDDDSAAPTGPTSQAPGAVEPAPTPSTTTDTAVVKTDLAWDCQTDLSEDEASVADSAPSVEEWVAAGYNVVPFSEFGGCQKQPSTLRIGYAHTEAGSLMAAATYAVALDPSVSEEAAQDLEVAVAEGSNRTLLGERAERIRSGLEQSEDTSAVTRLNLVGYIQNSYEDDRASYRLVYTAADSNGVDQTLAAQVDVVWEDGDWKLDPASGNDFNTWARHQGQPYVQWGPRS